MLLSLGVALARLRIAGLGRAATMSALRLVLGFAVGLAVATALGLQGTVRGVVILESAMPVAVFNYLWAVRYQTAPEEVAGMVLGSTVLVLRHPAAAVVAGDGDTPLNATAQLRLGARAWTAVNAIVSVHQAGSAHWARKRSTSPSSSLPEATSRGRSSVTVSIQ